jgi:hypothetical protein
VGEEVIDDGDALCHFREGAAVGVWLAPVDPAGYETEAQERGVSLT